VRLVDDFVVLVVVEVSPKEESLKLLAEDLDLWDQLLSCSSTSEEDPGWSGLSSYLATLHVWQSPKANVSSEPID